MAFEFSEYQITLEGYNEDYANGYFGDFKNGKCSIEKIKENFMKYIPIFECAEDLADYIDQYINLEKEEMENLYIIALKENEIAGGYQLLGYANVGTEATEHNVKLKDFKYILALLIYLEADKFILYHNHPISEEYKEVYRKGFQKEYNEESWKDIIQASKADKDFYYNYLELFETYLNMECFDSIITCAGHYYSTATRKIIC